MAQTTVASDRRQIYRPFLERLNPASPGVIEAQGLIVPPEHDPHDPEQPPIHVAFANTAELSRGAQMALVGGIGSGKTTELQLTLKQLVPRPHDQVPASRSTPQLGPCLHSTLAKVFTRSGT